MLRWLDEATVNGQEATAEQIADYKDRAAHMLDGVIKFLAGHFKLPAVHTVVREPMKNMTGKGFACSAVYPDKPFTMSAKGAGAFYLECQGGCIVRIIGGEERIIESRSEAFAPIKGNLKSGEDTIIVESSCPAAVRNAALFAYSFEDDERVPDYTPWVSYDMPEDFREFECCNQTSDCHSYREFPDVRREGHKTFLLPYEASGQFDFHYWRNPADIPADAPDDTELETEARAAQLIPLKLAADVTAGVDDTLTISYYLDNRFNYMIANILTESKGGRRSIETLYSMQ